MPAVSLTSSVGVDLIVIYAIFTVCPPEEGRGIDMLNNMVLLIVAQ